MNSLEALSETGSPNRERIAALLESAPENAELLEQVAELLKEDPDGSFQNALKALVGAHAVKADGASEAESKAETYSKNDEAIEALCLAYQEGKGVDQENPIKFSKNWGLLQDGKEQWEHVLNNGEELPAGYNPELQTGEGHTIVYATQLAANNEYGLAFSIIHEGEFGFESGSSTEVAYSSAKMKVFRFPLNS